MSRKDNKIDAKLIDWLIKTYERPEDLVGEGGILKQLQKAILERVLEGEMTTELGYEKHDPKGNNSDNSRDAHYFI